MSGRENRTGSQLFGPQRWQAIRKALKLSLRELEIVRLIFDDQKERSIAQKLRISPHTVSTYIQRLYRKLAVASRPQLILAVVAAALDTGLRRDDYNGGTNDWSV